MYFALILLICLSAFFSASETAISTVNKIRLQKYIKEGNKKAKRTMFILDNYDRALTTILIGNNLVNICASSLATVITLQLFGSSAVAISTGVLTLLILIFGEILPKCIAREKSESLSIAISSTIKLLMTITYPLVFIFIKFKTLILKFSSSDNQAKPSVTEQELKYIVENIEGEGVLEKQESQLVRSSLEFDEKTVQEILTPRVDMVTIDIEDPIEENTKIIFKERFSRIPVCRGSYDKIIGTLHTRDFLEAMIRNEPLDIESIMQPPFFVFKTKKLSSLLTEFKHNKMHLAIVTDDYGGTLGIVTMEDLLEQLVGDIWDEDEEIEHDYIKTGENTYEVSGDMSVRDLFDLFEIDYISTDFSHNTTGGWALEILSHIPHVGESFDFKHINVTVLEVVDHRIKKMSIIDNSQSEL